MIELKNIKLTVAQGTASEKAILNGIDLSIGKGEFVTVIGTNGAGKSTLLNLISGECLPTQGTIEIGGEDVTSSGTYQRASQISRVFQDPLVGSCGELTIEENMALAGQRGKVRGLRKAITSQLRAQFREALAGLKLGLENKLNIPMSQLSGGQRQAVSLVMSTLNPLKVLLLDEHTSALDPRTAEQIMIATDRVVRENQLTALMVTHSLTQALRFGTRTVLLDQGKVGRDFSGLDRSALSAHKLLEFYGSAIE